MVSGFWHKTSYILINWSTWRYPPHGIYRWRYETFFHNRWSLHLSNFHSHLSPSRWVKFNTREKARVRNDFPSSLLSSLFSLPIPSLYFPSSHVLSFHSSPLPSLIPSFTILCSHWRYDCIGFYNALGLY